MGTKVEFFILDHDKEETNSMITFLILETSKAQHHRETHSSIDPLSLKTSKIHHNLSKGSDHWGVPRPLFLSKLESKVRDELHLSSWKKKPNSFISKSV